jgi:hypothetical protein
MTLYIDRYNFYRKLGAGFSAYQELSGILIAGTEVRDFPFKRMSR